MLSETFGDLDPWHAFIGEAFDDMELFSFHDFDTFCSMNPLLLAKFAGDRFRQLSLLHALRIPREKRRFATFSKDPSSETEVSHPSLALNTCQFDSKEP
jgi:hypothetical protein